MSATSPVRLGRLFHGALELLERASESRAIAPWRTLHTFSHFVESPSTGLISFIVDMAGALVSPRMSSPKLDFVRVRAMMNQLTRNTRQYAEYGTRLFCLVSFMRRGMDDTIRPSLREQEGFPSTKE